MCCVVVSGAAVIALAGCGDAGVNAKVGAPSTRVTTPNDDPPAQPLPTTIALPEPAPTTTVVTSAAGFRPTHPGDPGMVLCGEHVFTAAEITRAVEQAFP